MQKEVLYSGKLIVSFGYLHIYRDEVLDFQGGFSMECYFLIRPCLYKGMVDYTL